ncbi:tyrosine-type recombinase/integrase [Desulfovibrio sulfodismutans]|uniref:Tyrosine-type recombinase/integrase n=1 Tax=Desulfolutivibrio sulfodismutans TaxID=63561 RepID=A0A7K3NI27_9BACT|nr:site-specific integrase [Desulfolutivibrio sulfodismutans]NDY55861.1 tyrosine-type recombinase/integrase [Desulfolutivibrio sulfodismutans]QLA14263.1 tyrosine-type recombinase/integrase [Desulfolutivibrio sulfodismutans DSM 3696]
MAVKWVSSKFPGVRYYEHASRKHGVRLDRYFAIRAQVGGKRREEGLGWASEGWSEQKAATVLSDLKKAHATGEGPVSLAEKRALADADRKAREEAEVLKAHEAVTLANFFHEVYFPQQAIDHKRPSTVKREEIMFRVWIGPAIGKTRVKDLGELHVQRVKKAMLDAGRSPRTIEYAFAVIRQIVNLARQRGLYQSESPTRLVKRPAKDNRRHRFLEENEAQRLLEALAEKSRTVHDQALLALNAGLRAGEIFSLVWADVAHDGLKVRDTKSGKNRVVPLTRTAREMLEARRLDDAAPSDLVFPSEKGTRIGQVSQTFIKTADELFNMGVEDARDRVVFHSLRHTFASWLVRRGTPLITVARLMGHATTAMTERYSHLAPNDLVAAVDSLEAIRGKTPGKVVALNG